MTSLICSFGAVTSTRMIGSSSTGLAFCAASWNAIEPAILNAIQDESTSWNDPSGQLHRHVFDRVAGEHASRERFLDAFVDRLHVLSSG